MGEYLGHIWTIFHHWIRQAYGKADHSQLEQVGIDETGSRKGHSYFTIAVDMDERRVMHVTVGNGNI